MVLDVEHKCFQGSSAAGSDEEGWRPERTAPELFAKLGLAIAAGNERAASLERMGDGGNADLGRILHDQVRVVLVVVSLDKIHIEALRGGSKAAAQAAPHRIRDNGVTVFDDENEMGQQFRDAVIVVPKIA